MENKTLTQLGTLLPPESVKDTGIFPPEEGFIQLIYGPIRNGKSTYTARCMYEDIFQGRSVYSNLNLDLSNENFDEREKMEVSLLNLVFGKPQFYKFSKANFHYFNPTTGELHSAGVITKVFDPLIPGDLVRWLNTLTDCVIYYDEGHWLLNSYEGTRVDMEKIRLITETGHCNRRIVIITQRTQAIHVGARANVNQYFRCTKKIFFFFFLRLQVEEFQSMKGNDVDDDSPPVSTRIFWSNTRYWNLFNTHVLRGGRPRSQDLFFDVYYLNFTERLYLAFWHLFGRRSPRGVKATGSDAEQVESVLGGNSKPVKRLSKRQAYLENVLSPNDTNLSP